MNCPNCEVEWVANGYIDEFGMEQELETFAPSPGDTKRCAPCGRVFAFDVCGAPRPATEEDMSLMSPPQRAAIAAFL